MLLSAFVVFLKCLEKFSEDSGNKTITARGIDDWKHTRVLAFPPARPHAPLWNLCFLERERDFSLYLQMLQTSVLDSAVREYRLKTRLRIKC